MILDLTEEEEAQLKECVYDIVKDTDDLTEDAFDALCWKVTCATTYALSMAKAQWNSKKRKGD